MSAGCDVSVVVPTYGGAPALPELCARIEATLTGLGLEWELLLIDDCSPDRTPEVAAELAAACPRLSYRRLARNVGQHAATIEGLRAARGQVVVTMDDDLQQSPESIPRLVEALNAGSQVAIARFPHPAHPTWRRIGSGIVHALVRRGAPGAPLTITSFKAFTRAAASRLVAAVPAQGPFYIGVVLRSAIPREAIVNVDVPHHARRHGRSGYGLRRLVRMAVSAMRSRVRQART